MSNNVGNGRTIVVALDATRCYTWDRGQKAMSRLSCMLSHGVQHGLSKQIVITFMHAREMRNPALFKTQTSLHNKASSNTVMPFDSLLLTKVCAYFQAINGSHPKGAPIHKMTVLHLTNVNAPAATCKHTCKASPRR